MLSRTEVRNGSAVESAILRVGQGRTGERWLTFTIGEVAKESGKSKPTVAKYVDMLILAGCVKEFERDMRYCTKLTTRSFKWIGTVYNVE